MTSTKPAKICVHCGEDCSAQPRIKDSHDNYYHKICHEAADQKINDTKSVKESTPSAPPVPDAASYDDKDPIPMMEDSAADLDDSSAPPELAKPFSDRPSLLNDDDDDDLILDESDGIGLQMDDSFGD